LRFQLLIAWPIGQFCIDAGVTIDLNTPRQLWNENVKLAYGRIPPHDVIYMDREAVALWKKAYAHAGWLHLKAKLDWWEEDRWLPIVREELKEFLGPAKAEVRVIYESASANIAGWSYG
jgi:hypothetical protein